jgi:hypothetical protein
MESIEFLHENQLKGIIQQHIKSDHADVDMVEGRGALNFLDIDDIPISLEGESVHPDSIIQLPTKIDLPLIPKFNKTSDDEFIKMVNASGKNG